MTEFESMVTAVNQKIDRLQESFDETQDSLVEVVDGLAKIPQDYIPRTEAELKTEKVRKWIVGMLAGIVLIVASLGGTLYLNHQATCGVRGVLTLAQSSSTRNPIPDSTPPEQRVQIQRQRDQAAEFYHDALSQLPILWACSGEKK